MSVKCILTGQENVSNATNGILPVKNGGTGVSSIEELKELIQSNVLDFDWGDENAIGDSTWWNNLKVWIWLYSSPGVSGLSSFSDS